MLKKIFPWLCKPTAYELKEQLIQEYQRQLVLAENQAALQTRLVDYYRVRIQQMISGT